jgi:hypothetical protein
MSSPKKCAFVFVVVVAMLVLVFCVLPGIEAEYLWERDNVFLLLNTRRGWVLAGKPEQYEATDYVTLSEGSSSRILKDTNVYYYRGRAIPALFRVETAEIPPQVYVISRDGEVFRVYDNGKLRFKCKTERD